MSGADEFLKDLCVELEQRLSTLPRHLAATVAGVVLARIVGEADEPDSETVLQAAARALANTLAEYDGLNGSCLLHGVRTVMHACDPEAACEGDPRMTDTTTLRADAERLAAAMDALYSDFANDHAWTIDCFNAARTLRALAAALADAERERDALAAFKAYTHGRLDGAGIPTHPAGPHSAEGCRVGDRFDLLIAERDAAILAAADAKSTVKAPAPPSARRPRRRG